MRTFQSHASSRVECRRGALLRPGFTIIEVLLAVGLTSLLMAAMYSAMNIYWTTAADSYDEIERGQIARALIRDIARDIKSVTFFEQETMDSEEESEEETVDADAAMSSYDNGLFGTSTDLVLYISRPERGANYVDRQLLTNAQERSSDAMIIRYFLADKGAGGLAGALADDEPDSGSSATTVGLARMKGDLAGLSLAINTGDIERQLQGSEIIAREVSAINFGYWDGVELQEEWDSNLSNSMPQAIEIILKLRTTVDPNDDRDPENIPGWLPESEHRIVVPVPVARPYVGDEL